MNFRSGREGSEPLWTVEPCAQAMLYAVPSMSFVTITNHLDLSL